MMTVTGEAAALLTEVKAIAERAQRTFGRLSETQLNWQPIAGEWSIAQCFEHLILVNAAYFPVFGRVARGEWRPTLMERLPFLPALFGKLVLKAVQPDSRRKFQARPRFQPARRAIHGDVIARFAAHQEELARHIVATAARDWHKIIITSPVASFMTYSLSDAYRIIVTHEQHHVVQAERVSHASGFPPAANVSPPAAQT